MLKINDVLRASGVKRWHIVNTSRQQNLAEHQWLVAMLAGEIATRLFWSQDDIRDTMVAAMVHDIAEVVSGDLPTPTKRRIEAESGTDIDSIFAEFERPDLVINDNAVSHIIKCADRLEAVMFLTDHGVGSHAGQVLAMITEDMRNYCFGTGKIGGVALAIYDEWINAEYTI